MASERKYQMARLTSKQRAREDALKILRDRIQEIGATSEGWAVEILLAAYAYLIDGAPIEIYNQFSTVEMWDRGILWHPNFSEKSLQRARKVN